MNEEIYKETMRKFIYISRLHRAAFESKLSSLGIHQSQHHLLMHIAKFGGLPSQKKLAEHFKISPAAVAVSLKKLESSGFIEREQSDDARVNKITITPLGKEVIEKTHELFEEMDRQVFSGISKDELNSANDFFTKILANLEGMGAGKE